MGGDPGYADIRRSGGARPARVVLARPVGAQGHAKDVIASLHAALVETLADPSVRQRLTDLGQGMWPRDKQTPEALAAQQKAEIEKWWPIIKAANIKAE
jgi:tripartite-type tricarboxylate transporter receptor subunit TctC